MDIIQMWDGLNDSQKRQVEADARERDRLAAELATSKAALGRLLDKPHSQAAWREAHAVLNWGDPQVLNPVLRNQIAAAERQQRLEAELTRALDDLAAARQELAAIKSEVGPLLSWLCGNGDWDVPGCDCEFCKVSAPRVAAARVWAERLRKEE